MEKWAVVEFLEPEVLGGNYITHPTSTALGWGGSGAGGSSYVYSEGTASFNSTVQSNLGSAYYMTSTTTSSGSSTFSNTAGTGLETGHSGNGYVKITTLK